MTIHDATIWKFPDTLSWKGECYLKPLTILGSKRAARIITVSESARLDIIKYTNLSSDKVVNASEAIGEGFRTIEDMDFLENIRAKYCLPGKFILSVGSIEPRKNLKLLLAAYKKLRSSKSFAGQSLVLTGRKAWGSDALQRMIAELKLSENVLTTGYVPEEDLVGIYNLADIFVYPSYYEGFGLPPLEAMACGTSVIASDIPSLREVLGDAAIFSDPYDADAFAARIEQVLADGSLKEELISKGSRQSRLFHWDDVAAKMTNVYKTL